MTYRIELAATAKAANPAPRCPLAAESDRFPEPIHELL
jgi:hypothetical protein